MIKITLDHDRIAKARTRIQSEVERARSKAAQTCSPVVDRVKQDALARVEAYKARVKAVFGSK